MTTNSIEPSVIPGSSEEEEAYLTQELKDTFAQFLAARQTFRKRCYQDILTMQQICADLEKHYME